MKPIIEVQGISKKFKIGRERQPYLSLRDSMSSLFTRRYTTDEEFLALDDVSFDVYPGDSVGIIGRNGAGKSTLLKILSKITPPSAGKIISRGRIASLLEVGTGFHPELTGRENIYLNGSILGLKKTEIEKQFDAIVDFSGVAKFLETPLKHYSSGMQLRLAFAVAAHLEPEILVIDEVLAVGDAEFQKKCMGKMDEVSKSGRTILFVSHNIGAIRNLCPKSILLNNGRLAMTGKTSEVIEMYQDEVIGKDGIWVNTEKRNDSAFLEKITVTNSLDTICTSFLNSEEVYINFYFETYRNLENFTVAFDLMKEDEVVFRSRHTDYDISDVFDSKYQAKLSCQIPAHFLNRGTYGIRPVFGIHSVRSLTTIFDVVTSFTIGLDSSINKFHADIVDNHPGFIFPKMVWKLNEKNQ